MGRATKWLKGFFGFKSSKDPKEFNNSISGPRNDKGRPSFAGPGRDSGGFCRNPAGQGDGWTKKYISETEREQSKHAIAVAAATAAAADAAVAAAQAAVAVVRLTSQGRGGVFGGGGGGRERWAAVKIQTTFRGYLARKALRALKGLVKIQALVRGYLVRKQATATLRGMQALIRAQATVRSKRLICKCPTHAPPESWVHRSSEIFDDTASEHTASVYSRRLSASFESRTTSAIDDTTPKIVEVDMGRPRSRSRRSNPTLLELGDDPFSHPQCPPHLSIPTYQHWYDTDWGAIGEECRLSTTQNTPRFSSNPPVTPTKSVCGDNFYFKQYGNHPNYMGHTKSFKAKVRSQSAPKQRPEMVWPRNKLSMNEVTGSRNSLSGLRMQRSCSHAQQVINFKNVVMGKLERFDS